MEAGGTGSRTGPGGCRRLSVPCGAVADTLRNRLTTATNPYLLQHAGNPVHWQEWGQEAFAAARALDRPILLSVGYASCHTCHVMAHESFEDPATAAVMNRHFVNVKVDREERPDVDRIYMDAVQALTGNGRWPMTVFLTPEGDPFFAGTYFPPRDRHGLPSFTRILDAVHEAWQERRTEVTGHAADLASRIAAPISALTTRPGEDELHAAYGALSTAFDREHGGFGGAPKFPQASTLEFLLRATGTAWAPQAATMLRHTLDAMARGGIHDHVGGGFARYAVDERWVVPHFEKMLYDNALLARLYVRAAQVLDEPGFVTVARDTLDYLLSDLTLPGGGFASAEDADSDGEEGRFYVFTHDEVIAAVGIETARLAAPVLGVTPEGNFEGSNVLHRPRSLHTTTRPRPPLPRRYGPSACSAPGGCGPRRTTRRSPPGTGWRSGRSPRRAPSSANPGTWTPPSGPPAWCSTPCAVPTVACCASPGLASPPSPLSATTTPPSPSVWWPSTRRPATPPGSPRHAASATT